MSKSTAFSLGNYFLLFLSLFLAAGGGMFYFHTLKLLHEEENLLGSIETSLKNEIVKVEDHYQKIDLSERSVPHLFGETKNTPYPFYLYENKRLLFWSDFNFVPNARDISGNFHLKVIAKQESFYMLVKFLSGENREVIYVIPLVQKYPIVNEYLKSTVNPQIFSSDNFELSFSTNQDSYPVYLPESEEASFYITFGSNYPSMNSFQRVLINFLMVSAIVFFIFFIGVQIHRLIKRSLHFKAFLWLFSGLLILRVLMIYFSYPFLVSPNELFNPRNYASSFFNPSLGDLFLNVLCFFAIASFLFRHYTQFRFMRRLVLRQDGMGFILSSILVFLSLIVLSVFFLLFNSLNLHSQWSLDISRELNFHFLKIVSYVIVIIGGIICFFLSHILFRTIIHRYKNDYKRMSMVFLTGTFLFIIVSLIDKWDFVLITIVNTAYFLLLYLFNFPQYLRRIQYLTFVYFFVASIPLCIVGAYSVYRYQTKKLIREKDRLASQLLVDNDVLTEYLLTEAAEQISQDVFIQSRILNPYVSKINIRQRVQRLYLNNQLEKYDVDVHLFNSQGEPLDGSGTNLNQILDDFDRFKLDTGLYFINQYEANSLKRYFKVVEIKRYSRIAGFVLIDLRLKRIIPSSIYPLLLIDNRYSGPDITTEYSYAIYDNQSLIFNSGSYNYSEVLGENFDLSRTKQPLGHFEDGMVHFSLSGENGRMFLISLKAYPLRNAFSNFSFLFVLFLINILLALIVITTYFKVKGVKQNYASRIQLFLNGAFLTPLMVISVSAVSVIVESYNENLEIENLEQAATISTRIAENLDRFLKRDISREELAEEVNGISRFAEIDINVFGNNGRLLATSQPLIYENDLLAEVVNPEAYLSIVYGKGGGMVLNEHLGRLDYKNTYMPIKSLESGLRIGILSLPYFDVRKELEENVVSVLTNVLNIFTVIFLIFLVLSYLASTWLTFPLRLITQKIRKTSLLDTNEPLEWNSDDEIGLMVGEYNTMLLNLEESKKALARSEKESAWREIARQVAHEIKNPLTPMQLTLQHMKRTLHEDQIDKEKRIQQIDALLYQISTLSDIATSFSTFAKMPVPVNEVFELSGLVRDTIAIYDKDEKLSIQVDIEERPFWVAADKKWMGQAIANILINAIHAVEGRKTKSISVSLSSLSTNKMLLTLSDNGRGIPEEIRGKIFMPNFSTKENGSGIGLAIAKRAVEHAGGKIWFESEEGKGTVFYIELPLVK